MFELWARKRPVDGWGFPFEWITNFDREEQKFYMMDTLDRNIYQEAMVVEGERLVLYREFPKIYTKTYKRNDNTNKK